MYLYQFVNGSSETDVYELINYLAVVFCQRQHDLNEKKLQFVFIAINIQRVSVLSVGVLQMFLIAVLMWITSNSKEHVWLCCCTISLKKLYLWIFFCFKTVFVSNVNVGIEFDISSYRFLSSPLLACIHSTTFNWESIFFMAVSVYWKLKDRHHFFSDSKFDISLHRRYHIHIWKKPKKPYKMFEYYQYLPNDIQNAFRHPQYHCKKEPSIFRKYRFRYFRYFYLTECGFDNFYVDAN